MTTLTERSQTGAGTRVRPRPGGRDLLTALPWLTPALVLIFGVVFFPIGVMLYNSTREISRSGVDKGPAGFDNYADVISGKNGALPDFWPIMFRTLVWVVLVVAITVLISLALAQLLNKAFPGRKIVRLAVIVPWGASVVMTTMVVYYGLEPNFGIFNKFFADIGLLEHTSVASWTKDPNLAFMWSIIIAIFVSLPFTTYTILAGLQTVPKDVLEAARMDGAGNMRTYTNIILPQLRPALSVAILINIINVFNSLPILKIMTQSIPGYDADTIITYIFKTLQFDRAPGLASALSVIAFGVVIVIVALYVWIVKPMKEVDS